VGGGASASVRRKSKVGYSRGVPAIKYNDYTSLRYRFRKRFMPSFMFLELSRFQDAWDSLGDEAPWSQK